MRDDKVKQAVGEAFSDWLSQHPITLETIFEKAIEKAVDKAVDRWMDAHEEEILDKIGSAALFVLETQAKQKGDKA